MKTLNVKKKYIIIFLNILVLILLFLIQFNDYYKKAKIDIICRQFGFIKENPDSCIGWIFFLIVSFYLLTFNLKTNTKHTNLLFYSIIILIIFANMDYIYRNNKQDVSTVYSLPHYFMSLVVILTLIYLISLTYSKIISIPIIFLFLIYFVLNIRAARNRNIYKRSITLIENTIVNVCIILLLYSTVENC